MMQIPKGYIEKYYKWMLLPALFPAVLLGIRFLNYQGKTYSGFQILSVLFSNFSDLGANAILAGAGAVIFALLTLVAVVLQLICRKKWTMGLLIGVEGFLLFFHATTIVSMKAALTGTGLFAGDLMVWDLGWTFVLSLVASYAALALTMKAAKIDTGYILLVTLSIMWLFPVFYIIMNALRDEGGFYVNYVIPKTISLKNFRNLLDPNGNFHYVQWFKNTLIVAIFSCILSSFIVLSTAYTISRVRFVGRKVLMNLLLVLGMFPSFMSMIAVYYILKGMGIAQSLIALVLVYSGGAALSYYIAKGFFDTIPKSLDEAAYLDGASRWTVFTRITIPLSKPIIIYTIMTSFMGPWGDYIFASVILGDKSSNYTVAMGLYHMLAKENVDKYFTQFAAGAVLVSIPIALLFISLQKYYVEGLSGSVKG